MSTRFHSLPVTGLASVRNARTRIYAAGADPKFRSKPQPATFRFVPAFPSRGTAPEESGRLWRHDMLDRLQAPLTRRRE